MKNSTSLESLVERALDNNAWMAIGTLIGAPFGLAAVFIPQPWLFAGAGIGGAIFLFGLVRFEIAISPIRKYEWKLYWEKDPAALAEFQALSDKHQKFVRDILAV